MKKTFGEWLLSYKGDNPRIKLLSDDYLCDYNINFVSTKKPHIKTAESMMWHIGSCQGSQDAKNACKEAAILYGEILEGWD
tara:strand:+ start:31 stop:273 length:243 start_codon:yes stop_codon:yes gene_type:complete